MGKRLFVGNLSYDTDQQTIRDAFSAGGRTVTDVHVMIDRDTGRPRGFGFVELSTDEEAQAAIEDLDGTDLDGRTINVNEAKERAHEEFREAKAEFLARPWRYANLQLPAKLPPEGRPPERWERERAAATGQCRERRRAM